MRYFIVHAHHEPELAQAVAASYGRIVGEMADILVSEGRREEDFLDAARLVVSVVE